MDLNDVKCSLGRCLLKPEFLDRFYEVFLNSHPSFPRLFENTDFKKQKALLQTTINYLLMYAEGSKFASTQLEKVAVIHDEEHVNIKPAYYKYWTESLMQVVKEHDKDFSPELEQQWRQVVDPGIQLFISKYKVQAA